MTREEQEKLVYEYLTHDLNRVTNDSDKYIDAMLSISTTTSSLGSDVIGILDSLNAMQKARLNSLQKELKNGLSDKEKPYGIHTQEAVKRAPSPYMTFSPKDAQTQEIKQFLEQLEMLVMQTDETQENNKIKLQRECRSIIEHFKKRTINLKNYITSKTQKQAWNMVVFTDPSKMDQFELDDIIIKMKLAVTKHSKKLKEVRDYFSKVNMLEEEFAKVTSSFLDKEFYIKTVEKYRQDKRKLLKPDTKELITEVAKVKNSLENKLERLPQYLNAEQKEVVSSFMPMIHEYYEDQSSAFVDGKVYLPMAKDLEEFHNSLDNKTISAFLKESHRLGFTMQHLYLLHWVAEELFKKYHKDITLGRNIISRQGALKYKKKFLNAQYNVFQTGVKFRNDVAHNGIIWAPDSFEDAIKKYIDGLRTMESDFEAPLDKENMPKRKVPKTSEIDKFANKYFSVNYHQLQEYLLYYNSRLEKVKNLEAAKSDENYKPGISRVNYLFSQEKVNNITSKDFQTINAIKTIISEEKHAR